MELNGLFEAGQVWRSSDSAYEVLMNAVMEDTLEPVVVYRGNDGVVVQTLSIWRERIKLHGFKLDASNEKGLS